MNVNKKVQVNVFQQAKPGEEYCGDSYFFIETEHEFICVLVDGLGSGKLAKESSQAVINVIKDNFTLDEEQLMRKCTKQLQGKRGVVLGILKLHFSSDTYTYSSVGNIGLVTKSANEERKHHIPHYGFLSSYERPLKKVNNKLKPNTTLILYSDGISYSELIKTDILFDDFNNWTTSLRTEQIIKSTHDDTTVIAMNYKG